MLTDSALTKLVAHCAMVKKPLQTLFKSSSMLLILMHTQLLSLVIHFWPFAGHQGTPYTVVELGQNASGGACQPA